MRARRSTRLHISLTICACTTIALTGCGGAKEGAKTPPSKKAGPPAAPPTFTADQVRKSLIDAEEVGTRVREISIVADFLKDNRVPMCSLSGIKLPGTPRLATRQFTNPADGKNEIKYAQVVALFTDAGQAMNAYRTLRQKAFACPAKQHVPTKRIRKNFTLFSHDDTWKVTEGNLVGWAHLRGSEKHVEPPSQTKYNVYHLTYDYNVRGNVVIASLYYERTEPEGSGDPIVQRATEVLTKQLRKIG